MWDEMELLHDNASCMSSASSCLLPTVCCQYLQQSRDPFQIKKKKKMKQRRRQKNQDRYCAALPVALIDWCKERRVETPATHIHSRLETEKNQNCVTVLRAESQSSLSSCGPTVVV